MSSTNATLENQLAEQTKAGSLDGVRAVLASQGADKIPNSAIATSLEVAWKLNHHHVAECLNGELKDRKSSFAGHLVQTLGESQIRPLAHIPSSFIHQAVRRLHRLGRKFTEHVAQYSAMASILRDHLKERERQDQVELRADTEKQGAAVDVTVKDPVTAGEPLTPGTSNGIDRWHRTILKLADMKDEPWPQETNGKVILPATFALQIFLDRNGGSKLYQPSANNTVTIDMTQLPEKMRLKASLKIVACEGQGRE